jgi:hypothetical protein
MRAVIALILGIALAGLAGFVLQEGPVERPLEWIGLAREVGSQALDREPVTVVIVPGRQGVAAVRAAVDRSRIIASTRDGFTMDRGGIVAADHRAASELLARAGWTDRAIRIGASVAPAVEEPEEAPFLTPTRIAYALWAAVALGLWIAWRAAAAIWLQIRSWFREWRRESPAPPETVLVLRVDSADEVASIRAGLPVTRILAAMPRGLALFGGWIVSAGDSVATDLAREVGWRDCVLEPFDPDPFGSISRRCDFIAEATGLELADVHHKAIWSVEEALAILLSEANWSGTLAREPDPSR